MTIPVNWYQLSTYLNKQPVAFKFWNVNSIPVIQTTSSSNVRQYLPKALADFNSQGRLTRENTKTYSEKRRNWSRLRNVRRSEISLAEIENFDSKVPCESLVNQKSISKYRTAFGNFTRINCYKNHNGK